MVVQCCCSSVKSDIYAKRLPGEKNECDGEDDDTTRCRDEDSRRILWQRVRRKCAPIANRLDRLSIEILDSTSHVGVYVA
jgi:hypothetical protein